MPETARERVRQSWLEMFGRAYPYRGTLEARPAERRGIAAWGKPTVRRLARASWQGTLFGAEAGGPGALAGPRRERKPTFTLSGGSLGYA
jgi:hypothetical protein